MKINQWYQNNVRGMMMEMMSTQRHRGAAIIAFMWFDSTTHTWNYFVCKKHVKYNRWWWVLFEGSVNKPNSTLINRITMDVSVLLLYLLIYCLIHVSSLLCTSRDVSNFASVNDRTSVENSPMNEIKPHLFCSFPRSISVISSNQFVLI